MHSRFPPRPSLLLRNVRVVPVRQPPSERARAEAPTDVLVRDGVVQQVRPGLAPTAGDRVVDADGRWLIPGLWDAHVHMQQWASSAQRLDVSGTSGPEQVTAAVAVHLAQLPADRSATAAVIGFGYRSGAWDRQPTVAELDAVSGGRPVALVSGDVHNGWLNSAALQALGLPPRPGPLQEAEWFRVFSRLDALPTGYDASAALLAAVAAAASRGVVGIADMELEPGYALWPDRVAARADAVRVRTAIYPDGLDDVLGAGLRTGQPLPGTGGLVTMGPLKVIFDGSVNTRTAFCCQPYGDEGGAMAWRGLLNYSVEQLGALCDRAHAGGLEVAVHAIGDAAVHLALNALERSGAQGSVEHVQLIARADVPRFAALGVRASVQPSHLLDDRDVTARLWPDWQDRSFALGSLLAAGADLRLGSDAPVARLDPWEAMAAAVGRSGDDRPPWTQAEALTPAQALAASTDGRATVAPGSPGDLALLDHDPLAAATHLRGVQVAATFLAGRPTFSRF